MPPLSKTVVNEATRAAGAGETGRSQSSSAMPSQRRRDRMILRFDARTGAVLNGPANAPLDPCDWPR